MSFVVLFPDLEGKSAAGTFGEMLARECPQATLVPILNGSSAEKLQAIAGRLPTRFDPVVSDTMGVFAALRAGYDYVVEQYPNMPVVRIDTAEHPLRYIQALLESATVRHGMAIGDLLFGPETLRSNSIDEFTNLNLFPELYRHFTGGQLALSGAYGFQAFAAGACAKAYTGALQIVAEAKRETGGSMLWGFDAAMILGALGAGVATQVQLIPAEELRDRPREKIAKQLVDTLAICCAANRLFNFVDKKH